MSALETILFVFFISLIVTVIFRQLKLSVILGYLLVGALVGPHAFGVVPDLPSVKALAEFGIVFLMFTVGLEFSLPKLFALKYPVFVIGSAQVILSILLTVIVGKLFGLTTIAAFVVGSVVAMSSTAIVIKQLNDQMELHSPHGLNAIGILLFQDLAVIPIIILIAGMHNDSQNVISLLTWAFVKSLIAIFLIFFMGRWLLKPLFHMIAKTRAIELFTLAVLLVTLTAAWITHKLDLTFALGAFLAGIMLAETEFRHQIEVEIRPFRDILLGLFFITIGMLTDATHWYQTWFWIGLLFSALVFGKLLLIVLLCRLSKNNLTTSLRTGLVLAQGGEFGFAILSLALNDNILSSEYGQVVLAALLLSIVVSPLIVRFNKNISAYFLPQDTRLEAVLTERQISLVAQKLKNHVILCGYGRVGQHIARLLDKVNFPYVGLDLDSQLVNRASLAGERVIYGDPAHPSILKAAGINHAKALVISFHDMKVTLEILGMVRQTHPDLPILVRCRDERELRELKGQGATQIIAELFEESLTISQHLLNLIQIPTHKISEIMQEVRAKDYDLLSRIYTGAEGEDETSFFELPLHDQLRPILISEDAYAVNHRLQDLQLKEQGIEVIAIRRNNKSIKPQGDLKLQAHDIVIVYGAVQKLEEAEEIILQGR